MSVATAPPAATSWLAPAVRRAWRVAQTAAWLVGAGILVCLLWFPPAGIHAFWNVLIPVAPALLAFAPGLWRNVCPLGTTALLPRHSGLSARRKLPVVWQGRLALIGVALLYLIVPLRHVVLDLNGPATATVILLLALAAVVLGTRFEWKSGWCSGACPVHPVERLYGSAPLWSPPNAHCGLCERCVTPCADATPNLDPLTVRDGRPRLLAGTLMVGGFCGFIWGWFHVPDYAGAEGWAHLGQAFGSPLGAAAVTVAAFLILQRAVPARHHTVLRRAFAAAAIGCYYWYRLPALFGFGPFPGDGMLVDLRDTLPAAFPAVSRVATTALFGWWLIGRHARRLTWLARPPFAEPSAA
ncbi:MAG: ferredoxin [Planctomycetota bacterium]